jgi:hypothetical protein
MYDIFSFLCHDTITMSTTIFSSLGSPGQPWGPKEKAAWAQAQTVQRSYRHLVLDRLDALVGEGGRAGGLFVVEQYGTLVYSEEQYPLFVVKSASWDAQKPTVLVTGGGAWISRV